VAASFLVAAIRVLVAQSTQDRATEDLRETQEKFKLLFAENPHPVAVIDYETLRPVEVNQAAIDRYGYSRAEFLTLHAGDLRGDGVLLDREAIRTVDTSSHEVLHRTKSGEIFIASISRRFIRFGGPHSGV